MRMPALFTRTSTPPKRARVAARTCCQSASLATSWCWNTARLAKLARQRLALGVQHVGDHHVGALGDEQARGGGTHAAGRAGDDGRLIRKSIHRVPCAGNNGTAGSQITTQPRPGANPARRVRAGATSPFEGDRVPAG